MPIDDIPVIKEKVFQLWEPTVTGNKLYIKVQALKRALTDEKFRWQERGKECKLTIHYGDDILCDDR